MTIEWRTRGTAHVLGDNVPHDGGIMARQVVGARVTDPAQLIPHLFEEAVPGFMANVKSGDFIIAGRNFGCGKPHTSGYIALQAFGLRVVCESAPMLVARSMMNLGLPCLQPCAGVTKVIRSGDDIEVDYETGRIVNLTAGTQHEYRPLDPHVREVIRCGGLRGALVHWLEEHPELREPLS